MYYLSLAITFFYSCCPVPAASQKVQSIIDSATRSMTRNYCQIRYLITIYVLKVLIFCVKFLLIHSGQNH